MGSTGTFDGLPPLFEHCIDDYRPMKVICIGAGISGILTAIRFPQKIQNLTLTVYDKNADVGGTWFENRYPGVRCDIPSHSYQYTFENNNQWSEYYSTGSEIQAYLQRTARKYGAYRYMKFNHTLKGATWKADEGKWHVTLEDTTTGTTFVDTCDIYLSATGILNKWQWPTIEGLKDFKGKLVHSANWEEDTPLKDKDVALIGAGSSGIQILPTIQPIAKRVDHYMSGKTWISPIGFGSQELKLRGATGNFKHSEEELEKWRKDPKEYLAYRHHIEAMVNEASLITLFGTPSQKEFQIINREAMAKKLEKKPEIMAALEPAFPPGCRRLTPGPGYLEALLEDNVEFINTKIKKIVPEGIETVDGKLRKVDTIICATGFDTTLRQPLPIIGEDGVSLDDVWNPTPECYFGIFPPKMPNHMRFLGPNGGPGTGSLIHLVECAAEYMIKVVQKLQREYIKSIVISPRANKQFSGHLDKYFTKTIYTQPCKSWMKRGKEDGRVVTLWSGSCIHATVAFENPRWEDFNYDLMPEIVGNEYSWLGNGHTLAQHEERVTTEYLDKVNIPPVINPEEHTPGGVAHSVTVPGLL
ncbi:cyclohexanone monooxygenase [Lophium mytilinum]|uniref:Cyclohexanone monooxygenase n=1 Tax=Lophium mytilinum TaxID=390894 RepID=A0A6A6QQG7_9PEZI|nr:cyclohexanone monooxygenase [Lophium mytilinum]